MSVHVLLACKAAISWLMASRHLGSVIAWEKLVGSLVSERLTVKDL